MKHTGSILKFAVAPCIAILLFALTLLAKPEPAQPAEVQVGQGMALQPPAFLKSAHAAGLAQVDFEFLLEEAGVTAYTKLDQEIDLTSLELDFKTIGRQTDQFISGIVIAPGYEKLPEFGENAEVQVFLHHDGWIVAYLTRYQTAATLFDWVSYDEKRLKDSTLIENVVRKLAEDAGVFDVSVGYYDFRNPEATNLMLAADHTDAIRKSESFEINIPQEFTVYESLWSSAQFSIVFYMGYGTAGVSGGYVRHNTPGICVLNEEQLALLNPGDQQWGLWSGELAKAKFPLGKKHKLSVAGNGARSYCGIAIVYREAAQ